MYYYLKQQLKKQLKFKEMKTQITSLRSGTKNQILNSSIEYSPAPSKFDALQPNHSGSNQLKVDQIWEIIKTENPNGMKVQVLGIEVALTSNWSISRKSVSYIGAISKSDLEDKFGLKSSKEEDPYIIIHNANSIEVRNGKNAFKTICPTLVTIL